MLESIDTAALDRFYADIAPEKLAALWRVLATLVTAVPRSSMRAHRWSYEPVKRRLLQAGELISTAQAERRVLILENPAASGTAAITRTLYAGLQLLLPGEHAACHRHSQSALRFVLEGQGAYTAVDGERAIMAPFDLVLTPNGRWHDHANDTGVPMIWLDGLDIPLIQAFDASFAERLSPSDAYPAGRGAGDCIARHGSNLRPARAESVGHSPLFHYPYAAWREALRKVAKSDPPDPHDGVRLEFTDPTHGGPIMKTMSAFCQWLPAGYETRPLRSTDGTVFVGVEGRGLIEVDGERFPIGPRDVVVVPSWKERRLCASEAQVLFSFSDRAAQTALGLWREQR